MAMPNSRTPCLFRIKRAAKSPSWNGVSIKRVLTPDQRLIRILATNHIIALEKENKELQQRIAFMEQESQRLRALNEKISLSSDGTPSPEAGINRQTTPDASAGQPSHSLASVRGQQPPSEHSSPSASEAGH